MKIVYIDQLPETKGVYLTYRADATPFLHIDIRYGALLAKALEHDRVINWHERSELLDAISRARKYYLSYITPQILELFVPDKILHRVLLLRSIFKAEPEIKNHEGRIELGLVHGLENTSALQLLSIQDKLSKFEPRVVLIENSDSIAILNEILSTLPIEEAYLQTPENYVKILDPELALITSKKYKIPLNLLKARVEPWRKTATKVPVEVDTEASMKAIDYVLEIAYLLYTRLKNEDDKLASKISREELIDILDRIVSEFEETTMLVPRPLGSFLDHVVKTAIKETTKRLSEDEVKKLMYYILEALQDCYLITVVSHVTQIFVLPTNKLLLSIRAVL